MSRPLLFTLDGNAQLETGLLTQAGYERGDCVVRQFPDGESYLRLLSECEDRDVLLLCSLHQPDRLILPLIFGADTAREFGARSVGLIAPYLGYMRQDTRFQHGEAISSRIFARLISQHFDWLVTVDPHLHRYKTLAEIYSIPHRVISAAPLLANWIEHNVENPLFIGPDSESEQWVSSVARQAQAPYVILEKTRHGDRDVEIAQQDFTRWQAHTPVLVDDMISTGHTLLKVIAQLREAGLRAPVCAAVHGLFAEHADEKLMAGGAQRIVTSNSIAHSTNIVDLSAALAVAVGELLEEMQR